MGSVAIDLLIHQLLACMMVGLVEKKQTLPPLMMLPLPSLPMIPFVVLDRFFLPSTITTYVLDQKHYIPKFPALFPRTWR